MFFTVFNDAFEYSKALNMFREGNYSSARVYFEQLGDYKCSKLLMIKSAYMNGVDSYYRYYTSEDSVGYNVAVSNFSSIAEYYEEAQVLVDEAEYMCAVYEASFSDFARAIEIFSELGEYEDAGLLLLEAEKQNIEPFEEIIETPRELPISEREFDTIIGFNDEIVPQYNSEYEISIYDTLQINDDNENSEEDVQDGSNTLDNDQTSGSNDIDSAKINNADWLIDAACEKEGVSNLEELKQMNNCNGTLEVIEIQKYVDSTNYWYVDFVFSDNQLEVEFQESDDVVNTFNNNYPYKTFVENIPGPRVEYHIGILYIYDADSEYLYSSSVSEFDLTKPVFWIYSRPYSSRPDSISDSDSLSDEEYWSYYTSDIEFDEILFMENYGEIEMHLLCRELMGIKDNLKILLYYAGYETYPDKVYVMVQEN